MSRLLLLSILVLWMSRRDNVHAPAWDVSSRLALFFGVYAALVLLMSLWSRMLARRVADDYLGRSLDRYNKATEIARYLVPVWFAVGIFGLGWGHIVFDVLSFMEPSGRPLPGGGAAAAANLSETYWRIPGLLVGTLPALAAWMGLWWAQYPADRALKEQNVIYQANEGMPIHAPPGFGTFFVEHFRQQLLFTLAPIILIISARDILALGYMFFATKMLPRDGGDMLFVPISLGIFVLAPELLRRVIPTVPLPPHWPLRRRLEALCRRAGLKYRDILLWQTNSSMGNAMVMGLFPQVRYIFLSDLLVETMTDEEIEAVFAHEIGHVVHRHMWWYVVFAVILMLFAMGPLALLLDQIPGLAITKDMTRAHASKLAAYQEQVADVLGLATFALCFGYLSRRFERQADVYAARTMQAAQERGSIVISHVNPEPEAQAAAAGLFVHHGLATAGAGGATVTAEARGPSTLAYEPSGSFVGTYGAGVVSSALHRVARINNIPLAAHEWLHGSIAHRMRYLHEISADAAHTRRFDRYMRRLYWGLVAVLVTLAAWAFMQYGAGFSFV